MQQSEPVTIGVVIPKLPTERHQYSWQERSVTKNAPFATNDTPDTRVRLIGSRLIALNDAQHLGSSSRVNSAIGLSPLISPRPSASAVAHRERTFSSPLNPHPVVPSIPSAPPLQTSPDDRLRDAIGQQSGVDTRLVGTQLERFDYRPRRLVAHALEPWELDVLRRRVLTDLAEYSNCRARLKDIYVELTAFDRRLTGSVSFTDLGSAFKLCNVPLSDPTLRDLCCVFVSESDSTLVNYEKVLSFVASSLQNAEDDSLPQTRAVSSYLDRAPPLSSVTQHRPVDFERIWQTFSSADISRNNSFSYNQMKSLADSCRIPLSETVVEQLIDRSHKGNGQYRWQQFLEQVGRFLNEKTEHRIIPDPEAHIVSSFNATKPSLVPEALRQDNWPSKTTTVPSSWSRESVQDLARALHRSAGSNSGRVSSLEASWLTKEYNGAFGLGFTDDQISAAVARCADGSGFLQVEQFLRYLTDA